MWLACRIRRFVHLHFDIEAVIGKMHVFVALHAEAFVGLRVRQIVSNVREPRASRLQRFDQRQSLIHGLMHGVRNIAQRIKNQLIEIVQQRKRRIGNGAEVGQVSSPAKAEAENLHVAVQQRNGKKLDAQQFERRGRFVERDARNGAELGLAVEHISERAANDLKRFFVRINRQRDLLPQIVRTNIIESHNVISVSMGKQNCIEASNLRAQGLLAKIRSRIDHHIPAIARKEQGRAKPVVVRVRRSANSTVASERRDAHGSARAEYRDF